MASSKKGRKVEPRPTCPECGRVVVPSRAVPCGGRAKFALHGVYCSSDCLLDAYRRGYPQDRVRG